MQAEDLYIEGQLLQLANNIMYNYTVYMYNHVILLTEALYKILCTIIFVHVIVLQFSDRSHNSDNDVCRSCIGVGRKQN